MAPRHRTLVRRTSVIALSILCYVLVLVSEPSRQLNSDDKDDKQSDQSDAIQAVGQSEARVARLRSVCDDQPATAPPPGPGVETVLLPGKKFQQDADVAVTGEDEEAGVFFLD